MLRLALRTEAAVAAVRDHGDRAALGAEAMPLVPIEERLRLAQYCDLVAGQKGGRRARVPEMTVARERRGQRIGKGGNVAREAGAVMVQSKEHFHGIGGAQSRRQFALDEAELGFLGRTLRSEQKRLEFP